MVSRKCHHIDFTIAYVNCDKHGFFLVNVGHQIWRRFSFSSNNRLCFPVSYSLPTSPELVRDCRKSCTQGFNWPKKKNENVFRHNILSRYLPLIFSVISWSHNPLKSGKYEKSRSSRPGSSPQGYTAPEDWSLVGRRESVSDFLRLSIDWDQ